MGRSASRPLAGIISPCARYQSPPQPKVLNSKAEILLAGGQRLQHGLAGGDHFLADAVAGDACDAVALHGSVLAVLVVDGIYPLRVPTAAARVMSLFPGIQQ
jgi:hypothetical protein